MESSMYILFFTTALPTAKKKKGWQRKYRLSELGGVFLLESPREREIFMGFALALPACNRNNEKRDCHFFLFNIRYRATDARTSGPYFVCRLTLMPHQILYFRRLKRKSYILGGVSTTDGNDSYHNFQ